MFESACYPNHSGGEETRQQLLQAATQIFLAEGFRAARVKTIAECAGVRLSAINYHFGGKEGLYLAVLRHHGELAIHRTPLLAPNPALPIKERFTFLVHSLTLRMLDTDNECRIAQLMVREMVNSTPALEVIFEHFNRPQSEQLQQLMAEILGPMADQHTLIRCTLSLFGQCMSYVVGRPMILRLTPNLFSAADWLTEVEHHIVTFSWGGLMAIRQELATEESRS